MNIIRNYLMVYFDKRVFLLRCDTNEIFILNEKSLSVLKGNGDRLKENSILNQLIERGVLLSE